MRERHEVSEQLLQRLYDQICFSDSFGVYGSDFHTCRVCKAGGSPYVAFEHDADCPMREVEEFLFGYGKYQPAEQTVTEYDQYQDQ